MKFGLNVFIQICALLVQGGTFVTNVVPEKYRFIVAGLVTLAQGALALYAHRVNPDGTAAAVAYRPQN